MTTTLIIPVEEMRVRLLDGLPGNISSVSLNGQDVEITVWGPGIPNFARSTIKRFNAIEELVEKQEPPVDSEPAVDAIQQPRTTD